MKDYSRLIGAYDMIEQIIKQPPFDGEEYAEWQKTQIALLTQFKSDAEKDNMSISKMEVVRDSKGSKKVKLDNNSLVSALTATAEFNGVPLKTIFDTGADIPVVVMKEYAEKCGFKEIPSPQDSFPLNGSLVRANMALIDSIKAGSIIFKNVVALVIHDDPFSFLTDSVSLSQEEKEKYKSMARSFDAIIGLPTLKSLGSIQLDFRKKEMILNLKSEVARAKRDANIFISKDQLFMGLSINNRSYVGFVDTGNEQNCINLSSEFYAANRDHITLSPQEKKIGIASLAIADKNASYKAVINPIVTYSGKTLSLEKADDCIVQLDGPTELHHRDGVIGLSFFKRLGTKVNLDFVNMNIDYVK